MYVYYVCYSFTVYLTKILKFRIEIDITLDHGIVEITELFTCRSIQQKYENFLWKCKKCIFIQLVKVEMAEFIHKVSVKNKLILLMSMTLFNI